MTNEELGRKIIELVGGAGNILHAENCMTRVRISVKDSSKVNEAALKGTDGVLGVVTGEGKVQAIVGPGKAKKITDIIESELKNAPREEDLSSAPQVGNWEENKAKNKAKHQDNAVKRFLKLIGNIFVPLIPALIASGLFNGLASLIKASINTAAPGNEIWNLTYIVFTIIGGSFISYLAIFTGINAAKQFGATQCLGGMIGAMSIMTQIQELSKLLGLFDADVPLKSILNTGKGGIIGVIFGVWLLSLIEKWLRKIIPDMLDLVLNPLISMLVISVIFILVVMPLTGFISDGMMVGLNFLIDSTNPVIEVLSGYILSALFLPMVMLGIHQGLIPIYTIQLQAVGYITLFPVLGMAGGGQVGAAAAIYLKARRTNNTGLKKVIAGALPSGLLGVAEPLIYGVTLPMGKPFITAGLGAGFGGAWCMLMHVASTSFGPSGLIAILIMQPNSMLNFLLGLIISAIAGFILTQIFIKESDVAKVGTGNA